MIFVRESPFFSELSKASLSSRNRYSDYVGLNISFIKSLPLSFLNIYAPPICFSMTNRRTDSFFPPFFPLQKSHSGRLRLLSPLWDLKSTSDVRREEVFDWVISFAPSSILYLFLALPPQQSIPFLQFSESSQRLFCFLL